MNLETAVERFGIRQAFDLNAKIWPRLTLPKGEWKTLHGFSKNLSAPGLRYHSWQGLTGCGPRPLPASDASPDTMRFSDKIVPNCGF